MMYECGAAWSVITVVRIGYHIEPSLYFTVYFGLIALNACHRSFSIEFAI